MRRAKDVASMKKNTNAYTILILNAEEKRPLGRPRCGREGNIKIYL
jgi:hypothetical protein